MLPVWEISFVLLPERLARARFAPSAPNSMGFSKVLSAYSPHPFRTPESVNPSAAYMQFPVSVIQIYLIFFIIHTHVRHCKCFLRVKLLFYAFHIRKREKDARLGQCE